MLCVSNYNLPLFSSLGADLLADSLDLIVEGLLLIKVADLVTVGLVLEIPTLLGNEGLPLLAHFLHHLEGSHLWVGVHYQGSCLSEMIIYVSYLFDEDHIG